MSIGPNDSTIKLMKLWGLKLSAKKLPSAFATDLAKQVGLLDTGFKGFTPNDYAGGHLMYWRSSKGEVVSEVDVDNSFKKLTEKDKNKFWECETQVSRLEMFQKLALTARYDVAIKVYTGIKLKEEQEEVLKLIAELTPAWVRGELADHLLTIAASSNGKTDNRSLANIANAILDTLDFESGGGSKRASDAKGGGSGIIKQFFMELTTEETQNDGKESGPAGG